MLMKKPFYIFIALLLHLTALSKEKPNILWIVVEDMSPHFGCYGEKAIKTPNVDLLAASGIRFENCFVTSPVCSVARSSLITGMYQTSIGVHHHRSGRGKLKIYLPETVTPLPTLFRNNGYLVLNIHELDFIRSEEALKNKSSVGVTKTDYNFTVKEELYDRVHWSKRQKGQPFFCQIQLNGGKYRKKSEDDKWTNRVREELGSSTARDSFELPPYLAEHPVIRNDWANYLDTVRYTDFQVGRILERLRSAGELSNTYIFFTTDHGISHIRNKQFCYDGGIHVPFILSGPGIKAGQSRSDLIEHIDLAATSLSLAGIDIPRFMQARDFLGAQYNKRKYIFSARDRCDETVDRIRAVRSQRFKYIKNYFSQRPYLQPNRYKDAKPIIITMRQLYQTGKLNQAQSLIMAEIRPKEELYDLVKDPFELNNLAYDQSYKKQLLEHRVALEKWIKDTGDQGQNPEQEKMYDSDMKLYYKNKAGAEKANEILRKNINLMKKWTHENK